MTYNERIAQLAKNLSRIATAEAVQLGKQNGTQAFRDVSEVMTGLAIALGEAVGMSRDDMVAVFDGIWQKTREVGGSQLRVADIRTEDEEQSR